MTVLKTFNVVEIDVSDDWAYAPAYYPDFYDEPEVAAAEKRSLAELAGGWIKLQLIVDPAILNRKNGQPRSDKSKLCLHMVAHVLPGPVEECQPPWGFYEGTLLGQAIQDNGCDGQGYRGVDLRVGEVRKLTILRTVEAEDESEAACLVREEDGYDEKSNPDGFGFY